MVQSAKSRLKLRSPPGTRAATARAPASCNLTQPVKVRLRIFSDAGRDSATACAPASVMLQDVKLKLKLVRFGCTHAATARAPDSPRRRDLRLRSRDPDFELIRCEIARKSSTASGSGSTEPSVRDFEDRRGRGFLERSRERSSRNASSRLQRSFHPTETQLQPLFALTLFITSSSELENHKEEGSFSALSRLLEARNILFFKSSRSVFTRSTETSSIL